MSAHTVTVLCLQNHPAHACALISLQTPKGRFFAVQSKGEEGADHNWTHSLADPFKEMFDAPYSLIDHAVELSEGAQD